MCHCFRRSALLLPAAAVMALSLISLYPAVARPAEYDAPGAPAITADAAVLMDACTGQILYDKNAGQRRAPASTTKIMTAILALEGGRLGQLVTVSPRAASVGEASLDLRAWEKLTLEELIYGALLHSGNDACVAIAEHITGTESNFVLLMNQKAKMIGARDTCFINTNGLPAAGHYTTAHDLAVITRYALNNPTFKRIVSTRSKMIGGQGDRYLNNTNRLLWSYAWADGVKTGTTNEAGNCLVASATREDRQLISVVLHGDDRWNDSVKLLDYGFTAFDYIRVLDEGEACETITVKEGAGKEVQAVASAELGAVIPKNRPKYLEKMVEIDRDLTAPIRKGQWLGQVTVLVKGKVVGTANLVADRDMEKKTIYGDLRRIIR